MHVRLITPPRRVHHAPFLSAVLCAILLLAPTHAQDQDSRIVMIFIVGLMASSYSAPRPSRIPNLRKLAREGVWAEGVIGVFPTVTYPSHTTLITGVPPSVHGVYDNRIFDPERRSNGAWFWYARAIQVP